MMSSTSDKAIFFPNTYGFELKFDYDALSGDVEVSNESEIYLDSVYISKEKFIEKMRKFLDSISSDCSTNGSE